MIPLTILAMLFLFSVTNAHQSIGDPTPLSYIRDCRIGKGSYCPGPCPRTSLRSYVNSSNPQVSVSRGGWLRVKTLKNNHVGGFARWSIVKIQDMHNHGKHRRFAFFYSCADQKVTNCDYTNKKVLCPNDDKNEYYKHMLHIPNIYDDGVYVLGFTWYGGLTRTGKHGFFGDYYDCTYIRIRGGTIKGYHPVSFRKGRSLFGHNGTCKAMVNKLGICKQEPCLGGDGPLGYKIGYYLVPAEFADGQLPIGIARRNFMG